MLALCQTAGDQNERYRECWRNSLRSLEPVHDIPRVSDVGMTTSLCCLFAGAEAHEVCRAMLKALNREEGVEGSYATLKL